MTYEDTLAKAVEWQRAAQAAESPVLRATLQGLALQTFRLATELRAKQCDDGAKSEAKPAANLPDQI